jgi:hypothetical protein
MPAVSIPLLTWAVRLGALSNDPVLLLTAHLQSAVPSSQTAVAVLVAAGQPALAQQLSKLYLPQYLASALTMSVVIVVAIEVIEAT